MIQHDIYIVTLDSTAHLVPAGTCLPMFARYRATCSFEQAANLHLPGTNPNSKELSIEKWPKTWTEETVLILLSHSSWHHMITYDITFSGCKHNNLIRDCPFYDSQTPRKDVVSWVFHGMAQARRRSSSPCAYLHRLPRWQRPSCQNMPQMIDTYILVLPEFLSKWFKMVMKPHLNLYFPVGSSAFAHWTYWSWFNDTTFKNTQP